MYRVSSVLFICILLVLLPFFPLAGTAQASYFAEEYEGVYVVINKAVNKLDVYLNDHKIYSFPIATGKNKDQTPEGKFQISNKVKNPWYIPKDIPGGSPENPLGTRWLGINVPETNGYKYGIHGTNQPWSIGGYQSQGCIRMHNKDVEWLFNHIPIGTDVIIIDEPIGKRKSP